MSIFVVVGAVAERAAASPWAETGDGALRQDIELLADFRAVDGITTQWPLPLGDLAHRLKDASSMAYPDYVRAAAQRVRSRAMAELDKHDGKYVVELYATNEPSVIRSYGSLGRERLKAKISAEWIFDTTALRLAIGGRTSFGRDRQTLDFDGSYVAQRVGDVILYGGYLSHWWGPGWISALSLSNNARPFPQIGLSRASTSESSWPVLNLLGPWQAELFLGVLDGPRTIPDVLFSGLRITINPLPGLEIGLARTQQFCGKGIVCQPLKVLTTGYQTRATANQSSDQGLFDFRYSNSVGNIPFSTYVQIMFEDTGTFTPIGVSHLYGASIWVPIAERSVRLTLEYANTVPTYNLFTFDDVLHGNSYNSQYPDGMRYRGRTLGMSLDSDSELASIQANWMGDGRRSFTLTYHYAKISHPLNKPNYGLPGRPNIVTASPVKINVLEARAFIPLVSNIDLDLGARLQDDQPRPSSGFTGSVEAALRIGL